MGDVVAFRNTVADLPARVHELPVTGSVEPVRDASPLEQEVVELFDLLRERLLRYLLGFNLPLQDCEEILQETFFALFRHLQRGRSRKNLRGWLFRVAHNLALKQRQRARRDLENSNGAGVPMEELLADPAPGPEDQLWRNQTQRRVEAVLRALPEQDRRCLWLRAEGLRYREIAGVLDMSLGAVSLSLGRSLARIARAAER
jgi:RNA polymerase sigma-70 factor (ECF subfamily)